MSLHTKYRPDTFKDVVGHDAVIKSLKKVVKERRAHAFIFTGGSGMGKTTLARIVANELAATAKEGERLKSSTANIQDVNAASNTGVEAMRGVVERAQYRAIGESPVKAIVVDEAHRLSGQAWDSLLKPIEEPPAHVFWFFCTTEPGKIPKTIKTRCVTFDLKPLGEDEILVVLADVAEKEGFEIDDDILEAIADASGGSPRQALVFLEACRYAENASEARQLMKTAGEQKEVVDFCRFLLKPTGRSWADGVKLLKALEGTEAESIRIVTTNYLAKVAIGTKGDKEAKRILFLIDCFEGPYNQSDKHAPLLLALGRALGLDG